MITGTVATIRWGYFEAAAINGYQLTRDKDSRQWFVTGEIVIADAFKLSQSPLRLVVPHAHGQWIWPIVSAVPRRTGHFSAELGKPISKASINVHVDPQAGIRPPPVR